jgi:hypothetical protein
MHFIIPLMKAEDIQAVKEACTDKKDGDIIPVFFKDKTKAWVCIENGFARFVTSADIRTGRIYLSGVSIDLKK